ncbi:MAG: hypothetical protein HUJ59_05755, partial [Bacilli bacterium]|nr:hypothetical protein [Bacilli bacterium]
GMAATVRVAVYSDSDFSSKIDETTAQTYTSAAQTYTFTGTWAANSYYKVLFNITNTSDKNGVAHVSKINFYKTETVASPDTIEFDCPSTIGNGGSQKLSAVCKKDGTATGVDQNVIWSVTNGAGSATIDSEGLLIASAPGTIDVVCTSASAASVSAAKSVTITAKTSDSALLLTKDSGLPTSYTYEPAPYSVDDVALEVAKCMTSGGNIQLQKNEGYIKNTYPLPANIASIQIKLVSSSKRDFTVSFGTSANDISSSATGSEIYDDYMVFVPTGNMTFFQISHSTTGTANFNYICVSLGNTEETILNSFAAAQNDILDVACVALNVTSSDWDGISTAYSALSSANKAVLANSTFVGYASVDKFIERYDYIVETYGYANFMNREVAGSNSPRATIANDTMIVVIISSITVISLVGAFFLL